ncbi:hypothetical protein AHAS_Ahas17G0085300 [Arachis hypogaea]
MAPKEGISSSRERKEKAPQTGLFDTNWFSSKVHEEHFFEITSKKKVIPKVWFDLKPDSAKNYRTMVRGRILDFGPKNVNGSTPTATSEE